MRIAASSSTISALLAVSSPASASDYPSFPFAVGHDARFGLRTHHPHPIIPYGGDAPDNNSTSSIENTREKSTSSKLLNTVSAGGAFHSKAAFVGTRTRTPETKNPPYNGSGELQSDDSTSSLSVATNSQQEVNALDTSSDEELSAVANAVPLRAIPKKKGPLKILFLSSDTGGGHRASAEALANQFQRLYPGTTYDLFDVWTDVETSWPY